MKISFILLSFIFPLISLSQSKKDLLDELKRTNDKLEILQRAIEVNKAQLNERINSLEKEITIMRTDNYLNSQSRTNQNNTNGSYVDTIIINNGQKSKDQNQQNNTSQNRELKNGDGLTPKTGATIYTGPRGGSYYINKNGNKTYIKKNK